MNAKTSLMSGGPDALETHVTPEEAEAKPAPARRGRPSDCTPEMEAAIFECLQLGMSVAEICGVVGVTEKTFRNWRKRSRTFAAMVRRGECEAVQIHLANIRRAATKGNSWRASAWWLEHRHPVRWGRTETVAIRERSRQEENEERGREPTPAENSAKLRKIFGMLGDDPEPKPARRRKIPSPTPTPGPEPADLPDSRTNGESNGFVEPEPPQTVPAPSSPSGGGDQQARPALSAGQMPTVFVGGIRSGQSAGFVEGDGATHWKYGYRLKPITLIYGGRMRHMKVFIPPDVSGDDLIREALRLLDRPDRIAAGALAAQEAPLSSLS